MKDIYKYVVCTLCLVLLSLSLCSFWPLNNSGSSVVVKVNATSATNNGAPMYVYVKEVEKAEFLKDEYPKIVSEAFPTDSSAPKIYPQVIIPGKKTKILVQREQPDKQLGIYFLFTAPGKEWKYISGASRQVEVILGKKEIDAVKSR